MRCKACAGIVVGVTAVALVVRHCVVQRNNRLLQDKCNSSALIARGIWKIAVVGVMGSGKSTLASELCELLSVKHVDLDQIVWRDGQKRRGLEVTVKVNHVLKTAEGPEQAKGWVCEGNYRVALTQVWGRTDLIVYLDTPPLLRILRVVQRELRVWSQGRVNNIGKVPSIFQVRFWLGLLMCVHHASGLSYQQTSLHGNLNSFLDYRSEERKQRMQEHDRILAAAKEVQHLQDRLACLKQELQEKKQSKDGAAASECICKIKEVTSALAVASKQAKMAHKLKVPASVPIVILRTQADVDAFKLQLSRHRS